jgi:hypothetical protein
MSGIFLHTIIRALLDEVYRVMAVLWVVPWVKDTVEGWMEIVAILNQW